MTILFSPKLFFGKNVVIITRPIIRASRGAEQIVNARENRTLFEVINGRGQIVSANDFFFPIYYICGNPKNKVGRVTPFSLCCTVIWLAVEFIVLNRLMIFTVAS